jgi:MFS family permease
MSSSAAGSAAPAGSSAEGASPRARYQITFIVLAVATGAYSLLQSMVSPVLPLLETSLHTSQGTVTWVLTAYLLSASVFTPILGRVGDMIGKEKVLVAVLVALALGSILAALATSISVMIVARAIQGVGGGVIPLAFGIVRDEFPREKVAGAIGVIAALLAVGGGLGLVLAGPIVQVLDYHWLFWIPGVVVAAAAIATHFVVPESPVRTAGKISWAAAVLLSGWLVALLVAVSEAPGWGWGSAKVVGLFVAAVALAVAWVAVEVRSAHPLIDMRMMRIPAVWTTNLVAFLPEFLQTPSSAGYGFGASITESGLIVLPMTVSMFIFGALSGRLSGLFSAKAVLVTGSAISVIPFAILAFAHSSISMIVVAVVIMGAGFGLAFSAMSNLIVDAVPSHQTGVASGMNANIRTIGGSIGERDQHQREQAALAHPELALVAGGTVVGDESE